MKKIQFYIRQRNQNEWQSYNGTMYQIVDTSNKVLLKNKTEKDGLTKILETKATVRLELFNAITGKYESPFWNRNGTRKVEYFNPSDEHFLKTINVSNHYIQIQLLSRQNNKPQAVGWNYKIDLIKRTQHDTIMNKGEIPNSNILFSIDGKIDNQGKTLLIESNKIDLAQDALENKALKIFNEIMMVGEPFVRLRVFLPNNKVYFEDWFKPIPIGSEKKYRTAYLNAYNSSTVKGGAKTSLLPKSYRDIIIDIKSKRGMQYNAFRLDKKIFFDEGKHSISKREFSDGKPIRLYLPEDFKGRFIINDAKGKFIADADISKLDRKTYKPNEKRETILLTKRTFNFKNFTNTSTDEFFTKTGQLTAYTIQTDIHINEAVYTLEELKSKVLVDDDQFRKVTKAILENFWFDTVVTPTGIEITQWLKNNLNRNLIIDKVLIPLLVAPGILVKDIKFAVKNIKGKSVIFFTASINLQALVNFSNASKNRQRIARVQMRNLNILEKIKGFGSSNVFAWFVVVGLEIIEWFAQSENERLISNLFVNIISSSVKLAISSILGAAITGILYATGVIAGGWVVIAVGFVIATIIGIGLQAYDNAKEITRGYQNDKKPNWLKELDYYDKTYFDDMKKTSQSYGHNLKANYT